MYFYVPLVALLLLDQIVKYAVRTNLVQGQSIPIISGIFHLT